MNGNTFKRQRPHTLTAQTNTLFSPEALETRIKHGDKSVIHFTSPLLAVALVASLSCVAIFPRLCHTHTLVAGKLRVVSREVSCGVTGVTCGK